MTNPHLQTATKQLADAGIETARLDALVLLSDVTGKDRTHLLAHPELELTTEQQDKLQKLLDRRATHEPLAYIRGKTEFYGREFVVSSHVLEPRPESETIIELLKNQDRTHNFATIIDVGTGSGALVITAGLELGNSRVLAVDIDEKCLAVAADNATKHGVNIECIQSDLLSNLTTSDVTDPIAILANLPYVPDGYQINDAAKHEPKLALFGGVDGLDLYKTMFEQLQKYSNQQVFVFTEALPSQHHHLANIARAQNYVQIAKQDFIQVFTNT